MRFLFSILVVLNLLLLPIFGDFTAGGKSMQMSAGGDCIATLLKGYPCPETAAPIVVALFHIDAFQLFSLAIFIDASILVLLLGVMIALRLNESGLLHSQNTTSRFSRFHTTSPLRHRTLRWFALIESGPPPLSIS